MVRVEKSLQCAGKPGACGHTVSYPSQKTVGGRGKYSFFPHPEKNIPGSVLGGGVTSNDRAAVEKRNQVRRRGKGAYMKRTVGNLQIPNNQVH